MTENNARGVFDQQVARYDAWYDSTAGRAVLAEELDAVRPFLEGLPHPWLEVGVGTGRIGGALGVETGIDPARSALALARRRSVRVAVGRGEALPFKSAAFGAVLFVTTLCFVGDPLAALREAVRVLKPRGAVVLGVIPADGPWGQHYRHLGAEGHAYYREAHFLTRPDLVELAASAGLAVVRTRSALCWPPTESPAGEAAREGDLKAAGFLAVLARRAGDEG